MKLVSKLVFGVLSALVFSSITMAAQSMGQASFGQTGAGAISGGVITMGQAGGITTVAVSPPIGCPVSLRAQHLADGSLVQAGSGHPKGVGQWLHLTLADYRPSQIVTARVTIHGLSNKARITQVAVSSDSSDVVRTMTVQFSAASPGSAAGDVRAPGMTAVQRIDLDSVAYADGSVWSFAGQQACRVTPDPFMLVAGR